MNIEMYENCGNNIKMRKKKRINGGVNMENVILIDNYIEKNKQDDCEWDSIRNIFQNAIKRKGLTKKQVHNINTKILREVREEK